MTVTACTVKIVIPDSNSLKGKRQVVKSILEQVRNKFNVSCAEVGDNDLWQMATLGIVCVNKSGSYANAVINKVVKFIENHPKVSLVDYQVENR